MHFSTLKWLIKNLRCLFRRFSKRFWGELPQSPLGVSFQPGKYETISSFPAAEPALPPGTVREANPCRRLIFLVRPAPVEHQCGFPRIRKLDKFLSVRR